MPRKGYVTKRTILADPICNLKLVTKLIDHSMTDDKKAKALPILHNALSIIQNKIGKEPLEVSEEVMNNVMPVLEVKARRIGGPNYQIPVGVRPERRTTLGLKWLASHARLRNERTMDERLANEIIDASDNAGSTAKKCEDVCRMTEVNRIFTHYCF